MANNDVPYISKSPGDLITAEAWNQLQNLIRQDIESTTDEAVGGLERVAAADNADKLSGKTAEEWSDEIVQRALQEIPKRTGYLKLFKWLKAGQVNIIEHELEACPLVDAYELERFEVVCAVDEEKRCEERLFFLYHSSEAILTCTDENGNRKTVEIEPKEGRAFKIPFRQALVQSNTEFTDESSLGDLETEFWESFFSPPNDRFFADQFCHSPWFERCCREERTVKSLKSKGDWDELWLKYVPYKTINQRADGLMPQPRNLRVCQFDWNTIGVELVGNPEELAVMLLLKV